MVSRLRSGRKLRIRYQGSYLLPLVVLAGILNFSAVAANDTYEIAVGDRLTVTVVDQQEFTGDYTVDDTGSILLAVVGPVHVAGLSIAQSQEHITRALADGILKKPSAFVRIAEYRPVQVLGDVRSPGSYPYRPGATVAAAIAQAAGYGTSQLSSGAATAEFLLVEERYRSLLANILTLRIREARISSQIEGSDTFDEQIIAEAPDGFNKDQAVREEQETLARQTDALAKQVELIRAQAPRLQAELNAVNEQINSEKRQLDLVQGQVVEYDKLTEKGLVRSNAMIELKLAMGARESNIWRLEAERSRLNSSISDLEIRAKEIETTRKRELSNQLEEVRQRLREMESSIPAVKELRTVRLQQSGAAVEGELARSISIIRLRGDRVEKFDAMETDKIAPGDVIQVRSKLPALGPFTASRQTGMTMIDKSETPTTK